MIESKAIREALAASSYALEVLYNENSTDADIRLAVEVLRRTAKESGDEFVINKTEEMLSDPIWKEFL